MNILMRILSVITVLTAPTYVLAASGVASPGQNNQCPAIFQQQMRKLHSSEILDLCEVSAGHPVMLVNTASHCGFTGQFEDLEAIHQKYKDQGLVVIGVSSDSFDQEDEDEGKAAEICYKNFGVSFTMLSTVPVTGDEAHPLFKEVARQSQAPEWNFYKYLISRDGHVVSANPSKIIPSDADITSLLNN
ncbi:glutathione peroxidase [Gynuella sunshinyii]|uniref:Glutathione peroxidase n=1 Tax=Gynuella sunshinyii YC6258 TaxID=1445510 RepID=A0A0C5VMK8_9GAMM|nr:glutathione peroxidase [Gynuella sunshinyii]AJQ95551.1 glutathione peroxidase [Gynuella sunshinyii YC6258]